MAQTPFYNSSLFLAVKLPPKKLKEKCFSKLKVVIKYKKKDMNNGSAYLKSLMSFEFFVCLNTPTIVPMKKKAILIKRITHSVRQIFGRCS